jgi:putative ABC transport system ATP-binding protein
MSMANGSTSIPAVKVSGVAHFYGQGEARNQVLFDNNLEVRPGEIVIMTGPSGSGKTTLLTLIGGLRTVQQGSLEVLGVELKGLAGHDMVRLRRRIGFIFQAHNLFESLTAYQTVKMAMELERYSQDQMDRRITELLTALGLGHRIHHKPGMLSGGQKQRVAIARALANRPKLILADEPTAALDEKSGRDVVTLLQQLAREEQCTSLIVTHDNRILDVADRIVNMVGGHIKSNVLVKESLALCEFLSKVAVFSALTPDMLSKVADKMAKERFSPGAEIVRQGEPGDKFYLISRGQVDVLVDSRQVRTQGVGEFFGEIALIQGGARTATVVARTDVEAYSLGKVDFQEALAASAPFKEQLLHVYFQRQ